MPRTTTTVDTKSSKSPAMPPPAISYKLSEKIFLDMGWTTQPHISLAYSVVTMKAKFAHPVISPWFQLRGEDVKMNYQDGKTLYVAKRDGSGKIYYPSGKLAIKIDRSEAETKTKVWVYGSGEVDRDGVKRPAQLCALFDSLGCGVVYNGCMKKRLVYNQSDGILWDSPNGLPVRWKWHNFKYGGPMEVVGKSTSRVKSFKEMESSTIWSYVSVPNLNYGNYINTAKLSRKEVSPVKPILLVINNYISLRIWDQTDITLSFNAKGFHTLLKIGVLYNPYDKLKITELDEFSGEKAFCPFETFPARTRSMQHFKTLVERARARCSKELSCG